MNARGQFANGKYLSGFFWPDSLSQKSVLLSLEAKKSSDINDRFVSPKVSFLRSLWSAAKASNVENLLRNNSYAISFNFISMQKLMENRYSLASLALNFCDERTLFMSVFQISCHNERIIFRRHNPGQAELLAHRNETLSSNRAKWIFNIEIDAIWCIYQRPRWKRYKERIVLL